MATFFGEIVQPSSRAFFDGSDDEDDISDNISLEVNELVPNSLSSPCDLLIIAEGNVAKGFAEHHLLAEGSEKLAEIRLVQNSDSSLRIRTKPSELSTLFKLNATTRLLDVASCIDIFLSNNLTSIMEPALKNANKILLLGSRPTVEFRCSSSNDLPSAFIRVLKNSSWNEPLVNRSIEQPNFVSGLSASVVTWCEASTKPCLVTICYTDTDKVERTTVKPLIDFFSANGCLSSVTLQSPGPTTYHSKKRAVQEESNMYL